MVANDHSDLTLVDVIEKVKDWGVARSLVNGFDGTARAQLLKCMSELGELADAELKGNLEDAKDGVGDTLVTLILYCANRGLSIRECLLSAYEEIRNRTGITVGGTFVKDE